VSARACSLGKGLQVGAGLPGDGKLKRQLLTHGLHCVSLPLRFLQGDPHSVALAFNLTEGSFHLQERCPIAVTAIMMQCAAVSGRCSVTPGRACFNPAGALTVVVAVMIRVLVAEVMPVTRTVIVMIVDEGLPGP
jgi:hypothetical protein